MLLSILKRKTLVVNPATGFESVQTNQLKLDLIKFYVEWVKVRALHKPTQFFHIQAGGHSSNLEGKVGFIYPKNEKGKKVQY